MYMYIIRYRYLSYTVIHVFSNKSLTNKNAHVTNKHQVIISLRDMDFAKKKKNRFHQQISGMQLIRYFAWEHAHEPTSDMFETMVP